MVYGYTMKLFETFTVICGYTMKAFW